MGFGLTYEIIDEKPVLFEVLHETDYEIISVIISGSNGDKLQSIAFDSEKLTSAIYSNIIYDPSPESTRFIAAIPIKVGDKISIAKLDKKSNELELSCTPIWFVDGGWASGSSDGNRPNLILNDIDGLVKSTQEKSDDGDMHDRNHLSPAVLISMFNVINPRNVVSYHLSCSDF